MESLLNFKRVDISAYTLKEADEQLKTKVNYARFANSTQAWKKAGSPIITSPAFKEFCADQLASKCKNKPGLGLVIIAAEGHADTRERPYAVTNVINEKGKRHYKTTYTLYDYSDSTHPVVLAKTTDNKSKALEAAKKLYVKDGFKGKAKCIYGKAVDKGEEVAFEINYAPSTNAKLGTFVYVGIENM